MEFDSDILRRYLKGEEKGDDQHTIMEWFTRLEHEESLRRHFRQFWNDLKYKPGNHAYDGSVVLGRIYHQIKLEESKELKRSRKVNRFFNILSKAAAILFIPLLLLAFLYRDDIRLKDNEVARSEIVTPHGIRTKFYLPDGSSGWLNGGSTLEFPTEFRGKSREVRLEGEAYFNVYSDPKRPFIVTGNRISVSAYGTAFNVESYPDDESVKVTLESGVIEVAGKRNDQIQSFGKLKPNQMCIYNTSSSTYEIRNVEACYQTAWKSGKLVFRNNETLSEVVKSINRWYNVDVVIKDKELEKYVYQATFQDETLDEVLKLLQLSAPIQYKNLGRKMGKNKLYEKRRIELHHKP